MRYAVLVVTCYEYKWLFCVRNKLSYTNGHDLDPYEEDLDQDGEENVDQAGGPNDDNQDGGANEENAADNQLLVPNNGHIGRNGNIWTNYWWKCRHE